MKISEARKRIGQLVLSFHGVPAGGAPLGPFTLQAVTHEGSMAWLDGESEPHPLPDLVLNETWPVDFDDPLDRDCPTTPGDAIISALSHLGLPNIEIESPGICIWEQDSAEKIHQRLLSMGWRITRTRPWKK